MVGGGATREYGLEFGGDIPRSEKIIDFAKNNVYHDRVVFISNLPCKYF